MGLGNFAQVLIGRDVSPLQIHICCCEANRRLGLNKSTQWLGHGLDDRIIVLWFRQEQVVFSLLQGPDRLSGLLSVLSNSHRGSLFSNFFITYWIYKNCWKWDSPCPVPNSTPWYRSTNWLEYLCTGNPFNMSAHFQLTCFWTILYNKNLLVTSDIYLLMQ